MGAQLCIVTCALDTFGCRQPQLSAACVCSLHLQCRLHHTCLQAHTCYNHAVTKPLQGILAALLLSILGATEEQIVADYIRSDEWHHVALAGIENDSRVVSHRCSSHTCPHAHMQPCTCAHAAMQQG